MLTQGKSFGGVLDVQDILFFLCFICFNRGPPFRVSFSLFMSFLTSELEYAKNFRWLESNLGPYVSEVTALPNVP